MKTKNIIKYLFFVLTFLMPVIFLTGLWQVYNLPKVFLLSSFTTIIFLLWMLKDKGSLRIKKTPLIFPVILYLVFSCFSALKSVNIYESLYQILLQVTLIAFFLIAANNISKKENINKIINIILAGGFIVSLIGIFQFLGGEIKCLPQVHSPAATFGNKNYAAQYIIIIIPLALFCIFNFNSFKKELLYGLIFSNLVVFLIFTRCKGAWVGLVISLAFCLVLVFLKRDNFKHHINRRKLSLLSGCFIYILLISNLSGFVHLQGKKPQNVGFLKEINSVAKYGEGTAKFRLQWWGNTLEMIKDNLFTGVGIGNWQFIYPLYNRARFIDEEYGESSYIETPHNDFLQTLAELGIFGFLSYLFLLTAAFMMALKVIYSKAPYRSLLVLFLTAGIVAMLGHSIFSFPFRQPVPLTFFWLFLALIAVAWFKDSDRPQEEIIYNPKITPYFGSITAVLVFLFAFANFMFMKADHHFIRSYNISHHSKDWKSALEESKKAVKLYPFHYRYQFESGNMYYKCGLYDQAIKAYSKAIYYHPNLIIALNNLGGIYRLSGSPDKAITNCKKALKIYPDFWQAHNILSQAYNDKGMHDEALIEHLIAMGLNPKNKDLFARHLRAQGHKSQEQKSTN